jgi:choline dehydrogenase
VIGLASDTSEPLWGMRTELQYTTEGGQRNDMMVVPAVFEPAAMMFDVPAEVRSIVLLGGLVAKPRSVGSLQLASSDPSVHPELHLNFLADRADLERSRECVRLMYDLARNSALAAEISEVLVPTADVVGDDQALDAWLRDTVATVYHGVGTCRMGQREDPLAVVSQRLAVHDFEGLYVADASVIPEIPTAVTNMTCYMIGERMADLLRAES